MNNQAVEAVDWKAVVRRMSKEELEGAVLSLRSDIEAITELQGDDLVDVVGLLRERDALKAAVDQARQRCDYYRRAVTWLVECTHGDEQTCGCRDRAHENLVAIAALTPRWP